MHIREPMSEHIEGSEYMRITDKMQVFGLAIVVLICAISVGYTVDASARQRSAGIISHGTINYDNGKVVINAADLTTMANEMDKLETDYKTDIHNALAQIGTYIHRDGSISHEDVADVEPQQTVFRALVNGILDSQSVGYLAAQQASDTNSLIYYKFERNNLLEVTGDDTGMPVLIMPATEENLTAQTAAWVDGHSLMGNGSDNYYFYQKGFIEGYASEVGATVEYHYDETGKIESAELIFP